MIFISNLLILHKINLNMHKIEYFSTINRNIEKQASVILINTYPGFRQFYYILGANLGSFLHGNVSVLDYMT